MGTLLPLIHDQFNAMVCRCPYINEVVNMRQEWLHLGGGL